ncbi:MAG: hypothetical protein K2N48_01700 [Muribaculaceae bacterium]|nr:hypothetical protein [Muribaculaceae bacterium]
MNLLYVTEDSIFLWDGSEYIKVGGQGTGTTFIPSIDKNGDLSWTNDGDLTNPPPVNIIGPAGKDGKDGQDGKSAYDIAVENGFTGTESDWLDSLKGVDGADGQDGKDGDEGKEGKSAYDVAVENGFTGSEADWLESLKGQDGTNGASFTIKGLYADYDELIEAHPTGNAGDAYAVGDSDYNEIYNWSVDKQEWENLGSLEGPQGPKGEDSTVPGPKGDDGVSPTVKIETTDDGVDITITDANGDQTFSLTNGTKGENGQDGKSAYELAVAAGYEGTEAEWLDSLTGADGKTAYEIAVDNGFEGTEEEWLESLKGEDGDAGADGDSPTISLSPTDNGTEITITDKSGDHVFEVENGKVGKDGPSIVSMRLDENLHLISTLSNGVEIDAGKIDIDGLTVEKTEVIDVKLMTQEITFDGETTEFDLPADSKTLMVYVNGLCLEENSDYTINEGTITFSEIFGETDKGTLHWFDKNSADSSETLWATEDDIDSMFG